MSPELPLIVQLLILIIVIIFFFLYRAPRAKNSKKLRIFIVITAFISIGILIGSYPLWKYRYELNIVSQAFDSGDCVLASERSNIYINNHLFSLEEKVLKNILDRTPKLYFLSTIGFCEYKQRNYTAAVKIFNELIESADASSYVEDKKDANVAKKLLNKIDRIRHEK